MQFSLATLNITLMQESQNIICGTLRAGFDSPARKGHDFASDRRASFTLRQPYRRPILLKNLRVTFESSEQFIVLTCLTRSKRLVAGGDRRVSLSPTLIFLFYTQKKKEQKSFSFLHVKKKEKKVSFLLKKRTRAWPIWARWMNEIARRNFGHGKLRFFEGNKKTVSFLLGLAVRE